MSKSINLKKTVLIWNKGYRMVDEWNKIGAKTITSHKDLISIPYDTKHIFILLELDWFGRGSYASLYGINVWQKLQQENRLTDCEIRPVSLFDSQHLQRLRPDKLLEDSVLNNLLISSLRLNPMNERILLKMNADETCKMTRKKVALERVKLIFSDINSEIHGEERSLLNNVIGYAQEVANNEMEKAILIMEQLVKPKLLLLLDSLFKIEDLIKHEKVVYEKVFANRQNVISLTQALINIQKNDEKRMRKHIPYLVRMLNTEFLKPGCIVNQRISNLEI